jgi:peptidyl-tRNA hydrolase, PTH1 family
MGTRHNVGFEVLDAIASRHQVAFESAPADALIARWRRAAAGMGPGLDDGTVLLVKPLTYMNLSGQAIGELVRYFRIDNEDVLVIVDEAQLPLGKLRARARGSAGGHNGLKSVIAHVGEGFGRLRLGVGRGEQQRNLADHVLARFDKEEAAEVERMIVRAADAVETFVTSGIAAVMNQYNGGDPATTE